MTTSNVNFGQGGRLYADATKRESDGLPWDHSIEEDSVASLPNKVVPKAMNPAASPPASSARSGSLREITTTILELFGMGFVTAGFFMLSPALGLIVAGLAMVVLGVATDRGNE